MNEDEQQLKQKEHLRVITPETTREMRDLLTQFGVWNEKWTEKKAAELLLEIRGKEKKLVVYFDEDDTEEINPHLGAEMKIVSIDVLHKAENGNTLRLQEQFQTSLYMYGNDEKAVVSEISTRKRDKSRAISGKITEDEDPDLAADRELIEELALENKTPLTPVSVNEEDKVSGGYPGLMTFTTVYIYETVIDPKDYRANYVNPESKLKGDVRSVVIDVFGWQTAHAA